MELLDLPQLAERADLPISLARYYRDRFILFVPSVRAGRRILHPLEAVAVLRLIGEHAKSGANAAAIETELEQAYPVTVITSQDVSGDGSIAGATGVVNALARMLDDRGARLEAEVKSLRDYVESAEVADQVKLAIFESLSRSESLACDTSGEINQIKLAVEDLRARQMSLASHEQLEWIGDVVAAAVMRPAESGSKEALERRLAEIQEMLRKPRPDADVAELRIAVDRLTEYVHSRDEEFHRVLQSLVGAMRSEVDSLHSGIHDLRRAVHDESPAMPLQLTSHRLDTHGTRFGESNQVRRETPSDPHKSRAPRRLGQPTRPQEAVFPDLGTMRGSD